MLQLLFKKKIVLSKGQIFQWRKDRTVTRCVTGMSGQRTENNYRHKRNKIGYRSSYSRCIQEIPKIVPEKHRVEFQSDHSIHGTY